MSTRGLKVDSVRQTSFDWSLFPEKTLITRPSKRIKLRNLFYDRDAIL